MGRTGLCGLGREGVAWAGCPPEVAQRRYGEIKEFPAYLPTGETVVLISSFTMLNMLIGRVDPGASISNYCGVLDAHADKAHTQKPRSLRAQK